MKHEELLTLVAQLSAANLKLRETINLQREHIEQQQHQLASYDCQYPEDYDGRY